MNWEETIEANIREVIDAIYEDGKMGVARIDVCNIATKQLVSLVKSEVTEARKAGMKEVVEWIAHNCPMTFRLLERWQAFLKEHNIE